MWLFYVQKLLYFRLAVLFFLGRFEDRAHQILHSLETTRLSQRQIDVKLEIATRLQHESH